MFLPIITHREARAIYFMGMAKNTGKTEAFNAVIREAAQTKLRLGLTSIGWDGELEDRLFQHAKPRIFVPAGFVCATSEALIDTCSAKVIILHKTRFRTLFGHIVIVQAHTEGEIELAGPLWGNQLKEVISYLNNSGAELILIDGAIDRSAAASPMLTDSCILATGAVLHKEMNVVISKTQDLVTQMTLPGISDPSLLYIASKVIKHSIPLAPTEGSSVSPTGPPTGDLRDLRDLRHTGTSTYGAYGMPNERNENISAMLKENDHLIQFNIPSDEKNIFIPEDTRAIIFGGHIPGHIFSYFLHNRSFTILCQDRLF